jgi:hypothetical protein
MTKYVIYKREKVENIIEDVYSKLGVFPDILLCLRLSLWAKDST